MGENEFDLDGKVYVSMKSNDIGPCNGCAFASVNCSELIVPVCWSSFRDDGLDVIFVEKSL